MGVLEVSRENGFCDSWGGVGGSIAGMTGEAEIVRVLTLMLEWRDDEADRRIGSRDLYDVKKVGRGERVDNGGCSRRSV